MTGTFMDEFPREDSSLISDPLEISENSLTWDDSYAIVLALRSAHPQVDLEEVSLGMVYRWILELPDFIDEPRLANEGILASIYQDWFEEVIST